MIDVVDLTLTINYVCVLQREKHYSLARLQNLADVCSTLPSLAAPPFPLHICYTLITYVCRLQQK
jgi:hypothetical protein